MRSQSRRRFLSTVSTVGFASFAGCSGLGGSSNDTTSKGEGTKSTTSTGSTTTKNTTDKPENETNHPQTFESFETLDGWSVVDNSGKLKKSTTQKYAGSQSAHVIGSKQNGEGVIHRTNLAKNPVDLRDKNLSLAFKCTSHDFAKVAVQLYAPDQGHIVELKRTLYGPKGKWVRVNLGTTGVQRQQSVDLSKVYEIQIVGRPDDPNAKTPIEFYVDDVKTVPAPKKGMVMLTFDDGRKSQYSIAYKKHMKKYGFPGVDAVITDAVYDDGFLTQPMMREMVRDGWDMIAHPNVGAHPMTELSPKKQERVMKDAKDWLKKYGYEGHRYMAVPKNVVGPTTFELAQKYFDVTLSFGGSPNALPAIQKDTILSRMYGSGDTQLTKQLIDYTEQYNQLSIFLFHQFGSEGISEKKFEDLLQYLHQSNVEIVTLSDLREKGLLI